jgi:hypothetical protein
MLPEYLTYNVERLYNLLDENPDLMLMGHENDQEYINFYNTMKNKNIGKFSDVYKYIDSYDYENATTLNSNITPESDLFGYMKTAIGIYLDSWCKGRYEFSDTEYEVLLNIALLSPETGGDGVYVARILLGIDPIEYGTTYKIGKGNTTNQDVNARVFPNPAKDKLSIEFDKTGIQIDGTINMYDITGRLVLSKNFSTFDSKIIINIESLEKGSYLYKVESNVSKSVSGKLSIIY